MSAHIEMPQLQDNESGQQELMQLEKIQVMMSAKSIAAIASLTTRRYSLEHVLDIIDHHVEVLRTSLVCLSTIRHLLMDSRDLLQKALSFPDPSAHYAFSISFNEFLNQIELIIDEASFDGKNLLRGDDLTVYFNQEGRSSFLIKGIDVSLEGLRLEKLEPTSTDERVFHHQILELEAAAKHLDIHSTLMESALTILSSRRTFAQKISHDLDEAARSITRNKILNTPARTQGRLLLGHSGQDTASLNSNLSGVQELSPEALPAGSSATEEKTFHMASALQSEFDTKTANTSKARLNPAGRADTSLKKKSLFSLFKSSKGSESETISQDKKQKSNKKKSQKTSASIGPLLKRLREDEPQDIHHDLSVQTPLSTEQHWQQETTQRVETLQQMTPTSGSEAQNIQLPETLARQLDIMNCISADIMRYLDGERFEQLWPLYQSGDYCAYIRELSGRVHLQKQDLIELYHSQVFVQRALQNFEISFHKLVKEEHQHSSLSLEQSIKHWLNSIYGEAFKVIFSICRMNNADQGQSLTKRLDDVLPQQ